MVSMTTVSPELIVSTGSWALSNQPHCVVSRVAGNKYTLPGNFDAVVTDCAWANVAMSKQARLKARVVCLVNFCII